MEPNGQHIHVNDKMQDSITPKSIMDQSIEYSLPVPVLPTPPTSPETQSTTKSSKSSSEEIPESHHGNPQPQVMVEKKSKPPPRPSALPSPQNQPAAGPNSPPSPAGPLDSLIIPSMWPYHCISVCTKTLPISTKTISTKTPPISTKAPPISTKTPPKSTKTQPICTKAWFPYSISSRRTIAHD